MVECGDGKIMRKRKYEEKKVLNPFGTMNKIEDNLFLEENRSFQMKRLCRNSVHGSRTSPRTAN
jgi:hypothetical protein